MDIKEPKIDMPPSAGVISEATANTAHYGNTEASGAGILDLTRTDTPNVATIATPRKTAPILNTVVTLSTTTTTLAPPNSSSFNNPSLFMPNMSTAVAVIPSVGSGFPFANTSTGLGFAGFQSMKKKRGRARKYAAEGSLALTVAPLYAMAPLLVSPSHKRGRGRPPGSGKNQQLAANLGELMIGSIGAGFTPHAITVAAGEDIASRIMSFSQQGPRGICILSANGAISSVTLRQPSLSPGGIVTYEGRFEILSLSGSFLPTDFGGSQSRTGGLSVSLARPDGRVVGGSIAGELIAASPVQQVIVGSFLCMKKVQPPKPAKMHDGSMDGPKASTWNTDNTTTCTDAPPINQKSHDEDEVENEEEDDDEDDEDVKRATMGAESRNPDKSTEGWPASQIITEGKHLTKNDIFLQG